MNKLPQTEKKTFKQSSPVLGVLPFIGVVLFVISAVPIFLGGLTGDWQHQLLLNAIIYMIGWAGVGAGISHIFFGNKISKSIGFEKSPYELEVGFADFSFGVVGLLAGSYSTDYWLAIILVSSLYRIGCGIGHIKQIIQSRNFAVNNTVILFLNFVVPIALLVAYFSWHNII
jgi:hypothetical protein